MGYKSDVKYPITVLRGGTQHQSLLDLLFPDPPVTFKLIKGSGPVHLLGNHSVGSELKLRIHLLLCVAIDRILYLNTKYKYAREIRDMWNRKYFDFSLSNNYTELFKYLKISYAEFPIHDVLFSWVICD